MEASEEIAEFWREFCETDPTVSMNEPYQIWFFSNSLESAAELVDLVIAGKKTATASLAAVNELHPGLTPITDGYSVVTDFEGTPKCVIRTEEVRHVPFEDVDERFAYDEGEGDRTLVFWRDGHHSYFTREAREEGVEFGPRSMICCERFKLLYHR